MPTSGTHNPANVARFSGFADTYDRHRPKPPAALLDLLLQLATGKPGDAARVGTVVDLGAGTGLSTIPWAARADAVVGVEPSDDFRALAERNARHLPNVHFLRATSDATTLPDASADVVTCSQSLHWMEPAPTFREVHRILRPGGVFAAYDVDWPPTIHPDLDAVVDACFTRADDVEAQRGIAPQVHAYAKSTHLQRLRESNLFRFTKEACVHSVDTGTADRLVGLLLSQGDVANCLKHGVAEAELGIPALRHRAATILDSTPLPWLWTYRVRLAVK